METPPLTTTSPLILKALLSPATSPLGGTSQPNPTSPPGGDVTGCCLKLNLPTEALHVWLISADDMDRWVRVFTAAGVAIDLAPRACNGRATVGSGTERSAAATARASLIFGTGDESVAATEKPGTVDARAPLAEEAGRGAPGGEAAGPKMGSPRGSTGEGVGGSGSGRGAGSAGSGVGLAAQSGEVPGAADPGSGLAATAGPATGAASGSGPTTGAASGSGPIATSSPAETAVPSPTDDRPTPHPNATLEAPPPSPPPLPGTFGMRVKRCAFCGAGDGSSGHRRVDVSTGSSSGYGRALSGLSHATGGTWSEGTFGLKVSRGVTSQVPRPLSPKYDAVALAWDCGAVTTGLFSLVATTHHLPHSATRDLLARALRVGHRLGVWAVPR